MSPIAYEDCYLQSNEKLILTDVDGVLLDWIGGFEYYMNSTYGLRTIDDTSYALDRRFGVPKENELALIQDFNHSPAIGQLNPFRDAVEYVGKLKADGYKFIVITSLSKHDESCAWRIENLRRVYGDDTFADYVFLDIGEHKNDALAKFEGTGLPWIEDLPKNAMDGHRIGLDTYLVNHSYNADFDADTHRLRRVNNWSEIYSDLYV